MSSLADRMLGGTGGCAHHTEALHGETVTILSGPDNGKTFTAERHDESDVVLAIELGADPRARRLLRFRIVPGRLLPVVSDRQTLVQTADGKKWYMVNRPGVSDYTVDYELVERDALLDT